MRRIFAFLARALRFLLPISCALLLMTLVTEPALAAEIGKWQAALEPISMIFSGIIIIIVVLSLIFSLSLGYLMDSTFILDSGMGDTLHLIWEVMRNFVNVGFIIILLVTAIFVIFKPGSEGGVGMLKKILPKFVLALIFVNLTFFGARFILTANDVLATSIFSLPQVISGDRMIRMPCKDPTKAEGKSCFEQIQGSVETYSKNHPNDPTYSKISGFADNWLADDKNWFSQTVKSLSVGKRNISLVLLTNMIDLEDIVREKSRLGDPSDFAIAAFGSLIVAGAVGVIFFMLFLAMVVRMVVLWVAIAVSPIVALGMVLKELIPGIDLGKGGFDPMKIFISHAFMPTMVAIPLSIGMIMIFANNAVGFDLSIGNLFTFSAGGGNISSILWWVASIIVIWFGTNKMIKEASPDFAAKLTDGIHNTANGFVKGAVGTLKYAPIMPGGTSMHEKVGAPMAAMAKIRSAGEERARARGYQFAEKVMPRSWTQAPQLNTDGAVEHLKEGLRANNNDVGKAMKHLSGKMRTNGVEENATVGSVISHQLKQLTGIEAGASKEIRAGLKEFTGKMFKAGKIDEKTRRDILLDLDNTPAGESPVATVTPGKIEGENPKDVGNGNVVIEHKDGKHYLARSDGAGGYIKAEDRSREEIEADLKKEATDVNEVAGRTNYDPDTLDKQMKQAAETLKSALKFHPDQGKTLYQEVRSKTLKNSKARESFDAYLAAKEVDLFKKIGAEIKAEVKAARPPNQETPGI
ncbi:MAG: hypothetical protein ABIH35_01600 [Patescibacteria group bacterium]